MNLSKTILTATICATSLGAMAKEKQPNLLFIFPDQLRQTSFGFLSEDKYKDILPTIADNVYTPNLDKLAKDSVIFTQAHSTQPVCSPYRAMLMSGMYPTNNGVTMNCFANRNTGLKEDITCFTDVLAAQGYDTAYVGKTHWSKTLPVFDKAGNYQGDKGGFFTNRFDTYIPEGRGRHGNRFWMQTISDLHNQPKVYSNQKQFVNGKKDGEIHQENRFSTIVESNAVISYLKNENNERPKDKPFSMIWSINPPHPAYSSISHVEKEVYEKYYKNRDINSLLVRPNVDKNFARAKTCAPFYFALLTSVDREVGRVLAALEASGEADNTIVVFTADHGEMLGSHAKMGKGVIYRESFMIPLFIRYPEKLKHRIEDLKISPVDMMPTILGMLGLSKNIPSTVQGLDFSNGILYNDYTKVKKPETMLYLNASNQGLVTDKYTYSVRNFKGKKEVLLFDNLNDPYQMNNLPLKSIPAKDLEYLNATLEKRIKFAGEPIRFK